MKEKRSSNNQARKTRKRSILRVLVTLLVLFICLISIFVGVLLYNNISVISNQDFLSRIDAAIAQVDK